MKTCSWRRLNARCSLFYIKTFVATPRNEQDAPPPDVPPSPATGRFGSEASFRISPADARGGANRLFILDFHQLTADVE
jgi:hypothetical protein